MPAFVHDVLGDGERCAIQSILHIYARQPHHHMDVSEMWPFRARGIDENGKLIFDVAEHECPSLGSAVFVDVCDYADIGARILLRSGGGPVVLQ